MNSFYSEQELAQIGFKSLGQRVLISRKASIYSAANISIGDNVRIDDFCILSGDVTLHSNIHISAYCALYGAGYGIEICDFSGLSARCTVYAAMDDFSGEYLVGPVHNPSKTNVTGGKVLINRYVQVGAHALIFPKITIGEGSVVGAMSMVNKDIASWGIYAGIPAKFIKPREKGLLKFI